jgi:ABC-2 type transport system permease protein
MYLLGRGVARFITGTFSVFVTIVFGVLFLKVPLDLSLVNWPLFFLTLLIGVLMLAFMGLILAGVTLLLPQHSFVIGDSVAGALFLFSGAIFPLENLPAFLRPIGFAMPITYWLELLRRTLVGSVAEAFPTLANLNNLQLLGILVGLTLIFGVASMVVFRACDRAARERGYLDRTSNY